MVIVMHALMIPIGIFICCEQLCTLVIDHGEQIFSLSGKHVSPN